MHIFPVHPQLVSWKHRHTHLQRTIKLKVCILEDQTHIRSTYYTHIKTDNWQPRFKLWFQSSVTLFSFSKIDIPYLQVISLKKNEHSFRVISFILYSIIIPLIVVQPPLDTEVLSFFLSSLLFERERERDKGEKRNILWFYFLSVQKSKWSVREVQHS